MKAIFLPSTIRKPFAFIDHCIEKTLDKVGVHPLVHLPGKGFAKRIRQSIQQFQPAFLLANLGCRLTSQELEVIQSLSIPTVIWYTDDPYAIDQSLTTCRFFDYIFTNEEAAISVYQGAGCDNVYHLPLATSLPTFTPRKIALRYQSDVLILGSAFLNRLEEVDFLARRLPSSTLKIVGPGWRKLSNYRRLQDRIRGGWVDPKEAARYYSGAKIVLNIHRAANDPHLGQNRQGVAALTPNNRLFEIASCRAYQLMSYRPGITSLFAGGEIDTYNGRDELPERIRTLLKQEKWRQESAERACALTWQQHRYVHRIQRILKELPFESVKWKSAR
ncbi:CgeB family protein [Marininema halotolerans]|uniref:Spore maturation protein CgeB n=1 Tax=Marininema halotolerans TaxID=1155944 RepID=A0A1I6R8F8_9BACL|nr:glycosyltransferase [Marininema halotolerans]SFS60820.1 spore maturation protein CgeB [Marininema halotolerans]